MSSKGRSSEGIYQADGKWCFKYRAADGSWKSKSTGIIADVKLKGQAFNFKDAFLNGKSNTPAPEAPAANPLAVMTLQAACDRWRQMQESTDKKKTTLRHERLSIKRLVEVFGAEKRLSTFTALDLDDYIVARRKKPTKRGTRLGARSINVELRVLLQVLRKAGLDNVAKGYEPLPEPKERVGKVLTPEQLKKLVALAEKREQWFVAFHCGLVAYGTGGRGIELRNLRLKNLQLDAKVPAVVIEKSKTDTGLRTIPLTPAAQWALRRLLDRARMLGATDPEHFLLPLCLSKITRPGDPRKGQTGYDVTQCQQSWGKAWRGLRTAAGLGNFRFHDLRCCALTNFAESGVPMEVAMTLAGHANAAMTRHYQYIQQQAQMKAVDAVTHHHTAALFQSLINPEMLPVQ